MTIAAPSRDACIKLRSHATLNCIPFALIRMCHYFYHRGIVTMIQCYTILRLLKEISSSSLLLTSISLTLRLINNGYSNYY